jgi:hypothetical protein
MSVVQKFDADTSAVEKALEKVSSKYDALAAKVSEVGKKSKQSTDDTVKSIDGYAAGLAKAAGAAIGLQTALGLVTQEMQKQKAIQEDIARRNVPIAQSQDAVAKMIGPVGPAATRAFLDQVRAVQKDTGFGSIAQLNLAAADTLSSTGGDQQKTIEILRAAAPLFRQTPEQLPTVAGGIADVMNASGLSALDATALANQALGQSRMTQLSSFKEIAKAIGGGEGLFGADRADSAKIIAGLFGSMSRASKDSEGATTKTAVVKMLQTLETMGDGTFEERLAKLQGGLASGELSEAKLMQGYDASSYSAVRSIFRNDPAMMKDLTGTINKTRNASRQELAALSQFLAEGTPEIRDATERAGQDAATEAANATGAGYDALEADRAMSIYREAKRKIRTWSPGDLVERFGDVFADGDALDANNRSAYDIARVRRLGLQSRANWIQDFGTAQNQERDLMIINKAIEALLKIEANTDPSRQQQPANPAAAAAIHAERD